MLKSFIITVTLIAMPLLVTSCDDSSTTTTENAVDTIYRLEVTENTGGIGQTVGDVLFAIEKTTSLSFRGVDHNYNITFQDANTIEYTYTDGDLTEGAQGVFTVDLINNTWSIVESSGRNMKGVYIIVEAT